MRVTDLTYENVSHITANKLIELLERNFGGGWESLPQSIQDIIESNFDISTTTLPADRLKKPGGLYEKKLADDYEVLVVPKGSWVEAIFAKEKPKVEKVRMRFEDENDLKRNDDLLDPDEDEDEDSTRKSRITTTIQMRMTMHSMTTSLLRKATVLPSKTRRTSVLMMQKM